MNVDPVTFFFLLGAVLSAILLLARLVKDPKIALYAAICTAPVTRSLGGGAFLHRLTISEIMGALFIIIWFINTLTFQHRRRRASTPLDSSVLFFVYILGLSFFINLPSYSDILTGIEEFSVVLYMVLFYFVFTRSVTTDDEVQRILDIWLLTAAFVVSIGLWDSLGHRLLDLPQIIGPVKEHDQYRVAATFRETGQLGVYLLTTFFVALACYVLPENTRRKRIGLALLMIGSILLSIFASRRSTYVSFLVGLAALLVIKVRNPRVLLPGLVICTVSFACIMLFLNEDEDFSGYFQQRVSILTPARVAGTGFIQLQLEGASHAFLENPIAGVGVGGFWRSRYDLTGNEIHSTYGQLLAETGILGLLAYALFMFMLLKLTYEAGFVLRDSRWSGLCSIIFPAFAGFGVSYMYNRHLRERTFWILVGVLMCAYRLAKARSRAPASEPQSWAAMKRPQVSSSMP